MEGIETSALTELQLKSVQDDLGITAAMNAASAANNNAEAAMEEATKGVTDAATAQAAAEAAQATADSKTAINDYTAARDSVFSSEKLMKELPPLKIVDSTYDIEQLGNYFLYSTSNNTNNSLTQAGARALFLLRSYNWPNTRQCWQEANDQDNNKWSRYFAWWNNAWTPWVKYVKESDLLAMNQYVQVSSRSAGQKVIKVTKKTAVELIVIKGQRGNNGVVDLSFYAQWDTWTKDLIYLFKNVGSGKQLPVFTSIDGASFYLDFTNCDTGYVGLFIEGAQKVEFFDSVPV